MRAGAAALAAALTFGGCASLQPPQTRALLAAAPADLAPRAERDTVPFFPQTRYHCGPAALATALGDVGLSVQPDDLANDVFLPAREGSLQTEMLAGTRRHGALAYRLPGTLQALFGEVAAGQAVIVLQNLGLDIAPVWHYAVIVGYDLAKQEVILRSGITRREVMKLATFEYTWARGGYWAFVALPPGRLPLGVAESQAVEAAIGFERVAVPSQAAKAYQSLLSRWPANAVAGMGLGNSHLAAGELAAAAEAFEQVAHRHDSAASWNNLAQVQSKRGLHAAAVAAAQRALVRAEVAEPQWTTITRQTLAEVQAAARP